MRRLFVIALVIGLTPQLAGASTPASYALGKAKSCRPHYVKRTERRKIGGNEVRYVACVYVAPAPVGPYNVDVVSTGNIFYGLPIAESDTFSALVTAPTSQPVPAGTVTFFSDGAPVSRCTEPLVPNEFGGGLSDASCTLAFYTTGVHNVAVIVTRTDGSKEQDSLGVYVVA